METMETMETLQTHVNRFVITANTCTQLFAMLPHVDKKEKRYETTNITIH